LINSQGEIDRRTPYPQTQP